MKICSWNVNGIRALLRKDALAPFVAAEDPDIICLQETKAQPGDAVVELPGFTQHWRSAEKKGYSGTVIFSKFEPLSVRHGVPPEVRERYILADDGYGDPHTEGRVLTAEYDNAFVVTVYTPNAKNDLSRIPLRRDHWDPVFLDYCRLLEQTKPVVFCGDLNVAHTEHDLARPGPSKGTKGFTTEERAGFQAFVDAGFVDTFRIFKQGNGFYTWWANWGGARERNVGWRIDYFLVSSSLRDRVTAAEIHPEVMGSDHCPVSVVLDI